MEAFSDGVLAIIITIMVLEMKVPHGSEWSDLTQLIPVFVSYLLSFVFLAIYWNNHHHLMHTVKRVTWDILWANMLLLFSLSLVPFVTGWMGENDFAEKPVALYGVVLLLAGFAYWLLTTRIIARNGKDSLLAKAIEGDLKGKASLVIYAAAVGGAWVSPYLAGALYIIVALMWIIPNQRIERILQEEHHGK